MKFTVAFILVVLSMVAAEVPRSRLQYARQTKGVRPSGQQSSFPVKSQPQQVYGPPQPHPSYGPPPAEPTTTETPTTEASTEVPVPPPEPLKAGPKSDKLQTGSYYVVLPRTTQSLLYTVPQSASLVALPRANLVAASLQTLPTASVTSSIITPYSASYLQIYQ